MRTFNLQAAMQSGATPDDIKKFLAANPNITVKNPVGTQTQVQPQEGLVAKLLPLIGSILGGSVGALGGPVGVIAGSAAGGGLGEFGRQKLAGGQTDIGKILGEAGYGALGGGAGVLLGGIGKAARAGSEIAAQTGTEAAAQAGSEVTGKAAADEGGNLLTKLGKSVRSSATRGSVSRTMKPGPLVPEKIANVLDYTDQYAGSAADKMLASQANYKKQLGIIKSLTGGSEYGDLPINGKALNKQVAQEVAQAVDTTSGIGKKNVEFWGNKIKKAGTVRDLGNINEELLTKMQSASKAQKEILYAIQKPLSTQLKAAVVDSQGNSLLEQPFAQMSQAHSAAPGLKKASEDSFSFYGAKFNKAPVQKAKDIAGRAIEKTGNAYARVKTPATLAGYNIGARVIGGGTGNTNDQYISPDATDLASIPSQYGGVNTTPSINITPEQVALARLTLPTKQADALEAAYKILNENKDNSKLTEAQVARKQAKSLTSQALQLLKSNPNISTGAIGGPLEQLKAKFSAADPASLEFNTLISNLTATIAKARAGTSFTPNEEKMLKQYAPAIGDSRQQLLTKLTLLNSAWEQ